MDNETTQTVITLITTRADALAQGNEKYARECTRLMSEREIVLLSNEKPWAANRLLGICHSEFNAEQVETARRIETWGKTFDCSGDDFTFHFLIGHDGQVIGHRLVLGITQ